MARNNALIRFYYEKDPEKLSHDRWCKYSEEIMWVLTYTGVLTKKDGQGAKIQINP